MLREGFPDGSVVKNLCASAGDTGSIPDLGRFHMLWGNEAHVPQLLSIQAAATEVHVSKACAPQQKKPPQREAAHHNEE